MPKTKNLPLSGSEPKFTNRRWGSNKGIPNNNCYAYAVGDYEAYRWQKSIPGDRSGLSNVKHDYIRRNCQNHRKDTKITHIFHTFEVKYWQEN